MLDSVVVRLRPAEAKRVSSSLWPTQWRNPSINLSLIMKPTILIAIAMLLGACSSVSQGPGPKKQIHIVIENYGGRQDFVPENTGKKRLSVSHPVTRDNVEDVDYGPLDQVTQCDAAGTQCRHGVIKSWVKYRVVDITASSIRLIGEAVFDISDKQELTDTAASMRQTVTMPDGITLFPKEHIAKRFDTILQVGQRLEFAGPVGARVVVRVANQDMIQAE